MSLRKTVSYTVLSLALAAGPAAADVTGADVWADWQDYWKGFGYDISGTENQSGDVLTVSDIAMSMALPEDEGTMTFTVGELTFTDTGSGTVSVGLPTTMPIAFDLTPSGGEPVKGTMLIEQDAPTMIVSGDPGDFTYTYTSGQMRMSMDGITVDGTTLPADLFRMAVAVNDMSSTTRTTVGDLRGYTGTTTASSVTYDVSFDIPEGPDAGSGKITGSMSDLTVTGDADFASIDDPSDMAKLMESGFNVTSNFSYKGGNLDVDVVSPDGPVKATTSSSGGNLDLKMSADGLRYDIGQSNLKVNVQTAALPFPVEVNLAETGFVFGIPIVQSDEPQDFAFGFTMGDFTMSNGIWNLFDPGEQLPRDPATISLQLAGTAKLLADIFDPVAMASNDIPGQLTSLDITKILIRATGAEVSGDGAFKFDNSDTDTFDGFPRPEGALDVRVTGANGLIDKLVTMGFLPQEQAMGARMMMGLFGVADGEDSLTSKIEVNDQGHVLANGQRLR